MQSRPNPNFTVLDVSDPSAPEVHARLRLSEFPSFTVRGVTLSGSLAYVAARRSGLHIIDVSDPSAPVLLGYYQMPGYANAVAVSGSLAYVADRNELPGGAA